MNNTDQQQDQEKRIKSSWIVLLNYYILRWLWVRVDRIRVDVAATGGTRYWLVLFPVCPSAGWQNMVKHKRR